jgi:hypothetical protein
MNRRELVAEGWHLADPQTAGRDTVSLAGQVHLERPREERDKIDLLPGK